MGRKIILEGVKEKNTEKYNEESTIYVAVENEFKKSVIGFSDIFNKDQDRYLKQDFYLSNIKNMVILPPLVEKNEFCRIIPPKSESVIMGIRWEKNKSLFNFNSDTIFCTGEVLNIEQSEKICDGVLHGFLHKEFNLHTQENYYDYHSSSLKTASTLIKLVYFGEKDTILEKLRSENSKILGSLLKLESIDKDLHLNKVISYDDI